MLVVYSTPNEMITLNTLVVLRNIDPYFERGPGQTQITQL